MNLLTDRMVWQMIGHQQVDPLYLIRILRAHKPELCFHSEEHHIDDTLVFLAGTKEGGLYEIAYHVNILTNDIVVMVQLGQNYHAVIEETAADIYDQLKEIPIGEARLARLLELVQHHLEEARRVKKERQNQDQPQQDQNARPISTGDHQGSNQSSSSQGQEKRGK